MRIAPVILVSDEDRRTLERWSRGRTTPARLVLRSKIVLLAATGMLNKDIVTELGTGMKTVCLWRRRFAERGLAGIEKDAPRGSRPRETTAALVAEIVRKTTTETPSGATHWSTRTLAAELGTSPSMVQRVWKASGLQPHRTRTFKLSNDPRFAEKLVDVVGLYLNPPEHALVLCVDEKSQIQALERTQESLPIGPGHPATMTHDYKRHGTTTLFAALDVADGIVIEACMSRHRHQEWIKFLEHIDAATDPEVAAAPRGRQLRDAQAPQGAALAGAASPVSHAFHPDEQLVAEPDRAVVPRADPEAFEAWAFHERPAACRRRSSSSSSITTIGPRGIAGRPSPRQSWPRCVALERSWIKPEQPDALH